MKPDFTFESQHEGLVAGVDEVGRGPWAGPVVAAACIVWPGDWCEIDDSKKLSKSKRENLYNHLTCQKEGIILHGIGLASAQEIDSLNILKASFLAFERALAALPLKPNFVLVDGNRLPQWSYPSKAIVKGDEISVSIACASIIAKVTRDRLMEKLSKSHPHYGWESNAGYGTKAHQMGLEAFGVTPHHRTSYAPIKKLMNG